MDDIEDDEEKKRKKAQAIADALKDLGDLAIASMDTERVFRYFLIQKIKDATHEFYKDMIHNLEAEGFKELNESIIRGACDTSYKISETIWDNQIDDRYVMEVYRFALSEAPKYGLDLQDITLEEDE